MRGETRLGEVLRAAPVPAAAEAERRGLPVVLAAFEGREPKGSRSRAPRLALAFATALVAAALALSPAGASVGHWVGDVFSASAPAPAPSLTEIPGGGRLLVESETGTWVVQADGSRRLLGRYEEASWSRPLGLFVAAASGQTLSAVEPGGTVHWTVSAPGRVSDPRWSPSGFRVAYRSGDSLRVVHATGSGDRLVAAHAATAPVWYPPGLHYLAYVDGGGALRVVDVDSGRSLAGAPALPDASGLAWSPDGTELLEYSRTALRVRSVEPSKPIDRIRLGPPRELPVPPGASIEGASFSPRDRTLAVTLRRVGSTEGPPRGEVVLIAPHSSRPRRLLSLPGGLAPAVWSPNGDRLLIPWPGPDEWLFIPTGGGLQRAFGPISAEFAPGSGARGAGFPEVEGWASPAAAPPG